MSNYYNKYLKYKFKYLNYIQYGNGIDNVLVLCQRVIKNKDDLKDNLKHNYLDFTYIIEELNDPSLNDDLEPLTITDLTNLTDLTFTNIKNIYLRYLKYFKYSDNDNYLNLEFEEQLEYLNYLKYLKFVFESFKKNPDKEFKEIVNLNLLIKNFANNLYPNNKIFYLTKETKETKDELADFDFYFDLNNETEQFVSYYKNSFSIIIFNDCAFNLMFEDSDNYPKIAEYFYKLLNPNGKIFFKKFHGHGTFTTDIERDRNMEIFGTYYKKMFEDKDIFYKLLKISYSIICRLFNSNESYRFKFNIDDNRISGVYEFYLTKII